MNQNCKLKDDYKPMVFREADVSFAILAESGTGELRC